MKHRHEVIASAQLSMAREAFFFVKTTEAAKADTVLILMFVEIVKDARQVED